MPFQTEKFLVGAEGSLSTSGSYTFDVPEFDPNLGTLTGAPLALITTFEATVDVIDTTGDLASASTNCTVSTTYSASDPSGPTFATTTVDAYDGQLSFLFSSNEASVALDGVGYNGSVALENIDKAIGNGSYQVAASYAPSIISNASTTLVSESFSHGLEVSYTYLPPGEGGGDDTLLGGAGHDFLGGGTGADFMRGGLDNDQYVVDSTGDEIDGEIGYSLGGGVDTVRSFISYTLPRNVEILRLQGDSNINGFGNWAPESLVGNTGNNRLAGSGGTDQLNGKAGNDVLIGGAGADTMVGDTGADIFRFNAVSDSRAGSATRDFINGFTHGQDRINLFEIDANTNVGGNQAFRFIGSDGFSGDGEADFQVFVNLTNFMVASDLIL